MLGPACEPSEDIVECLWCVCVWERSAVVMECKTRESQEDEDKTMPRFASTSEIRRLRACSSCDACLFG